MGLLNKNLCVVCGRPVKMFSKTAKIEEGSVCENCIGREFTAMFVDTHADAYFKMDKLPEYRKYRAENIKLIKGFKEGEVYFDTFHIDVNNELMIIHGGDLDHTMMMSDPAGTRYDALNISDIIYMDYLYNYIDLERESFQDYLICDIYLLIVSKSKWYPYVYYAPISQKAKLQVKVHEDAYEEMMDNDDDLDDSVFQIVETGEILRFRQFVEKHMSQKYLSLQRVFKGPELTAVPSEYEKYAEYFFKKIHVMKKLGEFDRDYYKRFLDKNIANEKLKMYIEDRYW